MLQPVRSHGSGHVASFVVPHIRYFGLRPLTEPTVHSVPPWTAEQVVKAFEDKKLEFEPGARWAYSEWGYCLPCILMWTEVMSHYGYGWIVIPSPPKSQAPPGHFQLVHSGSINGYTSEILRFPTERTTVIVLANVDNAHTVGSTMGALVLGQTGSIPVRTQ
jgi:hypothetical protein